MCLQLFLRFYTEGSSRRTVFYHPCEFANHRRVVHRDVLFFRQLILTKTYENKKKAKNCFNHIHYRREHRRKNCLHDLDFLSICPRRQNRTIVYSSPNNFDKCCKILWWWLYAISSKNFVQEMCENFVQGGDCTISSLVQSFYASLIQSFLKL